jgi:hypothetical protein
MALRKKEASESPPLYTGAQTDSESELAGVTGPGRWLVFRYLPVSLFSLKASQASSGVGRTLLTPTYYAAKMAFLDAALSNALIVGDEAADGMVRGLARAALRIGVPSGAVVTHTIVKVRQEPKEPGKTPGVAYTSNIAYREFVAYRGELRLAFDLHTLSAGPAELLTMAAPFVQYIGKRGSFMQFVGSAREVELDATYTVALADLQHPPTRTHICKLDDFGPEANFDAINSFSATKIKRGIHRKFVETVVPLGLVNVGPGFTQYEQ